MSKSILLICTSAASMKGEPAGAWSEEVTGPYYTFTDAGSHVTIASISGGKVPISEKSLQGDAMTESDRRFQSDPNASHLLDKTPALKDVKADEFDAVFLAGGHGACVDFADNLAECVTKYYVAGKIVGAVCHGPCGLVNAKNEFGEPLVKDKNVTGFSNEEEQQVGLKDKVPFLLETKLRDLGGKYSCAPAWEPHAVSDGTLVTGQNPASAKKVAILMLAAFKAGKRHRAQGPH